MNGTHDLLFISDKPVEYHFNMLRKDLTLPNIHRCKKWRYELQLLYIGHVRPIFHGKYSDVDNFMHTKIAA